MKRLISVPIGLTLILTGLLLQGVGAERTGYLVELVGNRLAAEPDILP
jgi:hypothetical protein